MIEKPATATPSEIDTELARLNDEKAVLGETIYRALRMIEQAEMGVRAVYRDADYVEATIVQQRATIAECTAKIKKLCSKIVPLDVEFSRRGGWTRYYLVEDGHLHYDVSANRCSRARTTRHYWMTEFSGMPEKMVIAKAQDRVCTVCFPDAPVAPRQPHSRFMTRSEAERAAYAEEKERRDEAKKAAQITTPDGKPLYTVDEFRGDAMSRGDLVKTERSASNHMLAAVNELAFYGASHSFAPAWVETARRMAEALAHRTGRAAADILAEAIGKATKKAARKGYTAESSGLDLILGR